MKLGILCLVIGACLIGGIIYAAFVFPPEPIAFYGRMIVGGLSSLWLIRQGASRIRRAQTDKEIAAIEKLVKPMGFEIKEVKHEGERK